MAGPLVDDHPMTVSMDEATKLALFEQTIVPHLNAAYNLAAGAGKERDIDNQPPAAQRG